MILNEAESFVDKPYGFFTIVTHVLDWFIGGSYVFRKFAQSDGYPTCSHIVAKAYGMVGKTFGNNSPAAIQPDCIHDFVKDNPLIYEKIHELKLIPKRRND